MQVFVYGTLKPGGHYYELLCRKEKVSSKKAKLFGKLYDLDVGYPALQLGGSEWVYGNILNFTSEALLKKLDELEGYNPLRSIAQNEYQRVSAIAYDLNETKIGFVETYIMELEQLKHYEWRHLPEGYWNLE
jgi:gamma-glutamylcyclotransferase (GGCT)/AIG2-like uncharacterized protein YtfP